MIPILKYSQAVTCNQLLTNIAATGSWVMYWQRDQSCERTYIHWDSGIIYILTIYTGTT